MSSFVGPILGWIVLIVSIATPIFIIRKSMANYKDVPEDVEPIRLKAMIALAVWFFMGLLPFGVTFELVRYHAQLIQGGGDHIDGRLSPVGAALAMIYFGGCYLLIAWVSRRPRFR